MREYYYLDGNNERKGPVALEDLASYGVTEETMVWKEGMANWQSAGMVPEVIAALSASPATTPPPSPAPPSPAPAGGSTCSRRKPDNNLVWAILTTILCCLPFGIASIVYSTKVDSAWDAGDYDGAERASKKAATLAWISVGAAFLTWGIYGILIFAGLVSAEF